MVISDLETPTNSKGISKLLGYVGWYQKLIPNFSKMAVPITQLLKMDVKFMWTDACQRAFEVLRYKLSTYPILRPLDWSNPSMFFATLVTWRWVAHFGNPREKIKIKPLLTLASN